MAQPTCDDTHSVTRPSRPSRGGLGIRTVSTVEPATAPVVTRKISLRVPSAAVWLLRSSRPLSMRHAPAAFSLRGPQGVTAAHPGPMQTDRPRTAPADAGGSVGGKALQGRRLLGQRTLRPSLTLQRCRPWANELGSVSWGRPVALKGRLVRPGKQTATDWRFREARQAGRWYGCRRPVAFKADRQTDRQTYRQTDRQAGRQAGREI
jgi:hypothetical protein